MKTPIPTYTPHVCGECGQTTTYASKINKGMVAFLRTFANAVHLAGENDIRMSDLIVDPKTPEWADADKRMAAGRITHSQYDNRSHLRCHGFIQNLSTANRYCLTKKGAAFLRGQPAEAVAVVDKKSHSNTGYAADADGVTYMTTIRDIMQSAAGWWDGWNYEIIDGRLVFAGQPEPQSQLAL